MENIFTFGKYKGEKVTTILLHNLNYFGWCIRNVEFFRFSIRDLEIYLSYSYTCENNLCFTGYANENKIIQFIKNVRIPRGEWDEFPDDKFIKTEDIPSYMKTRRTKTK